MSEYHKPLPKPTPTSRPFWEAARRHELSLQRCAACKAYIYYPRDRCPHCFSDRLGWERLSGRGKVYSYTVGLQKHVARTGHLPPGLEKRMSPASPCVLGRLGPLPPHSRLYLLGRDAYLINYHTREIIDILRGAY